MKALRLEIYQPTAHYRIPYSINRRLTYPLPPYSTVIGFLCNACGVYDQRMELYQVIRELKIAIAGRFATKHTEYVWYRNLAEERHLAYYGAESVREKNGQIGHIGGQIPVRIDVLEDVELIIHLYHEKVELLKEKLETCEDRLQPLHLGRAEDLVVIKDLKLVDLVWKRARGAKYFFWIPEKLFGQGGVGRIRGITYYLTTLSSVPGYTDHYNHAGRKVYKRIRVKLSDGKIRDVFTYFDEEKGIPVFLGSME